LTTLECTFIPANSRDRKPPEVSAEERARWGQRYIKALGALKEAGIETLPSEQAGVDQYIVLRSRWNHHVVTLANYMGWRMEEIDIATPS
jgi:hypothetical protein